MTAPADSVRRQLLALAAKLLAGAGTAPAGLRVVIEAPGSRVELTPLPGELEAGPPAGLSPLEAALFGHLSDTPRPAKALAHRAGYRMGSHVYQALRNLARRDPPLAVKTPDGYRRPPP